MKPGTRKILSWVFGISSGVSLVLAAAGLTALAYHGKITPGTVVGGVAVGGLTPQQAKLAISTKASTLSGGEVSIKINSQEKTAKLDELGVELLPEETEIFSQPPGTFAWLTPQYWQGFFAGRDYPISYEVDRTKFLKTVEKKFNLRSTAKNAKLSVKNNVLAVSPAVSGKKIDISTAISQLQGSLIKGQPAQLEFAYSETAAEVSTEAATQTKTEIEKTLKPVELVGDGRYFTLTPANQYTLIDYSPANGRLAWKISEDKLKSYLEDKITWQLNIAMVQKIVQIKPEAVLQQGRDGRYVVINTLVASVYQRITEQNTNGAIEIPLQTVPSTESRVPAGYIPNLFEGRYVDVNLARQQMYIVEGEVAIKTFLISSGQAGLPTPKGVFYIKNKIPLAQSRLYPGIWMRYWNALAKTPDGGGYEGYGIHDLPCFDKNCNYIEGASHLGRPVSHGCVRLGHTNAVWFYSNIPIGTPVNIH